MWKFRMIQKTLTFRIQKFFEPSLPLVACEINRRAIALVRLDSRNPALVDRFSVTPLAEGLVAPSLIRPNITALPDFVTELKSAFAKAEIKTSRISLALPDASAKVSLHPLDTLPGKEHEKQQLLRWKLKKTVPFNIDDAHVTSLDHKLPNGKHLVLTVCIHKEVLAQYEEAFQKLGIHAGYICLSSFATFELLSKLEPDLGQRSVLLLRVRSSGVSSLIVQEGRVVLFRQTDVGEEAPISPAVGVPDLFDEIHPCVTYYQDKLSPQPLDKIYVACPQDPPAAVLSSLSERFRSPVMNLDPLRFFQSPNAAALRNFKNMLMPSLGLAAGRF
jgi:type IV pilus assembly protein PilM